MTTVTTVPVQVLTGPSQELTGLSQVACAAVMCCALKDSDGTVWCWGDEVMSALDAFDGSPVATPVLTDDETPLSSISRLAGGNDLMFAQRYDSFWASWGRAALSGQSDEQATESFIGVGDLLGFNYFSSLDGTEGRVCGVAGNELYCWGWLPFTPLIDSDVTLYAPTQMASPWSGSAVDVAVGFNHLCVVLSDGTVRCTGQNLDHQLGVGSGPDAYDDLVQVEGVGSAVQVESYSSYTCALTNTSEVWCWGDGSGPASRVQPAQD